jgi:SAM-dependent methyltransferase
VSQSVSFDRASEFYDATRGLPAAVRDAVADVLAAELAGRRRVLEIGVGTGRIAVPLAERGVDVVGIDLSAPMLQKLRAKTGAVPVAVADATQLPLAASSVDAVLACHVLHLIPPWRHAVDEAVRVLRPGGVFLADLGGPHTAPWTDQAVQILADHGILRSRPGVTDRSDLERHLGVTGLRPLPPVPLIHPLTLEEELEVWEGQILGWTWPYPQEQLADACAEIREWASAGGQPLDEPVEITEHLQWWAFDVSA